MDGVKATPSLAPLGSGTTEDAREGVDSSGLAGMSFAGVDMEERGWVGGWVAVQ